MRARAVALAAVAVCALVGSTAVGCSGPAPSVVCVPELSVSPDHPRPGRIVTVSTVRACPMAEGTEWNVRIQPDDARIPLAQARVTPDADGSFEVSITVPPTIRPGGAIAWISDYWETVPCPGSASCASAEVRFTVEP
jgi:hypothetical protein